MTHYIPELEDLYFGFELERPVYNKQDGTYEWARIFIGEDQSVDSFLFFNGDCLQNVRVPFLTKKDVISEGFTEQKDGKFSFGENREYYYVLECNFQSHTCSLDLMNYGTMIHLFSGYIRCINDLRKMFILTKFIPRDKLRGDLYLFKKSGEKFYRKNFSNTEGGTSLNYIRQYENQK